MTYELLLYAHIIGACVLIGTGAGIAFFFVLSNHWGNAAMIAHVGRIVVLADTVFTATAFIFQPITGFFLAREIGWPLTDSWLLASLILYVVVGIFWLPVVWIQIRLRDIAHEAVETNSSLPSTYRSLYRIWLIFGFPAFIAIMLIVWLMISKPDF
ncbi:DUF2269 family protein [Thalassospira lucentensis]|uniref:DUF2269 family protein n=1 Tax=Thalassospira lucentensis TaxID=168935 RepID=UPI00142E3AAA|nr:DUF2269 domain-containing protein [Thalassospira lucentensis]NIZ00394.1 DUF2269 domain-containing protein [Thalassospira lucentensis]